MRLNRLVPLVGALAALAAVPAAHANVPGVSDTRLASRAMDGGFPNGPSQGAAFSQDRKGNELLAFDSYASNLVPGDVNGQRDVFVVHRAQPYDWAVSKATNWIPGGTQPVSNGLGGAPSDGPSWGPNADGDQLHRAHCIAFLSAADNLVPGDTNGKVDAFVKDLSTGVTTRVSVGSQGQQADGDTYNVQIDGACDRVAFTSDATNLAFTSSAPVQAAGKAKKLRNPCAKKNGKGKHRKGHKARKAGVTEAKAKKHKKRKKGGVGCAKTAPDLRSAAVTTPPPPGTRQVYVRVLNNSQPDDA